MKTEKVNIFEMTKDINQYANFVVGEVNDHVVRAAVIDGDFHWHKHENCDELFLVVEGELLINFEDRTETLLPGDVYTVNANVLHRTRSNGRTVNLCFEKADNDINGNEMDGISNKQKRRVKFRKFARLFYCR